MAKSQLLPENPLPEYQLYSLFEKLRKEQFPLGTGDFLAMTEAFKIGIETKLYLPTKESQLLLCQMLWVKSKSQLDLFNQIFDELFSPQDFRPFPGKESAKFRKEPIEKIGDENKPENELKPNKDKKKSDPDKEPPKPDDNSQEYYYFLVKNDQNSQETPKGLPTPHSVDFVSAKTNKDDYIPITPSEMLHGWYLLKRLLKTRSHILELNIPKTIDSIRERGKFITPILSPKIVKKSNLVLMLDVTGSMQPFQYLGRQLVKTGAETGSLTTESCLYFQNLPSNDWLFKDSDLSEYINLEEASMNWQSDRTVIIIFSDGGAAKNDYHQRRINATKKFLTKLREFSKVVIWLNPLPKDQWSGNSAGAINALAKQQLLTMLPIDSQGWQKAIDLIT